MRPLQQLGVPHKVPESELRRTRLARSEQFTRSPQDEVHLGELEPVCQPRKGVEAL